MAATADSFPRTTSSLVGKVRKSTYSAFGDVSEGCTLYIDRKMVKQKLCVDLLVLCTFHTT